MSFSLAFSKLSFSNVLSRCQHLASLIYCTVRHKTVLDLSIPYPKTDCGPFLSLLALSTTFETFRMSASSPSPNLSSSCAAPWSDLHSPESCSSTTLPCLANCPVSKRVYPAPWRVVVNLLTVILSAGVSDTKTVLTSMLHKLMCLLLNHSEKGMCQHFSNNVSSLYIFTKSCIICTWNVCTDTNTGSNVLPSTVHIDERAFIYFRITFLASTFFQLVAIPDSGLKHCFAYVNISNGGRSGKQTASFSHPASLTCSGSCKRAFAVSGVPTQVLGTFSLTLPNLNMGSIIYFTDLYYVSEVTSFLKRPSAS